VIIARTEFGVRVHRESLRKLICETIMSSSGDKLGETFLLAERMIDVSTCDVFESLAFG
jgi:hypothetical protein